MTGTVDILPFQGCAIVGSITITLAVQYGFGQEVTTIATSRVPKVIMFDYLAQSLGIAGGTIGRISFIVLITGLLGSRLSYRVILWVFVGLQVVVNTMFIVIIFSQCPGHASAIWEHSGKAQCWDLHVQAYYGYFQGGKYTQTSEIYLAYLTRAQRSMQRPISISHVSQHSSSGD